MHLRKCFIFYFTFYILKYKNLKFFFKLILIAKYFIEIILFYKIL